MAYTCPERERELNSEQGDYLNCGGDRTRRDGNIIKCVSLRLWRWVLASKCSGKLKNKQTTRLSPAHLSVEKEICNLGSLLSLFCEDEAVAFFFFPPEIANNLERRWGAVSERGPSADV